MTSAVLDASAVLALIREEPGGERVAEHVGRGAISAVNLQEVVKELLVSGLDEPVIRELLSELRLDVRVHDADFAAAALHEQTKEFGRGLGDRFCMALALTLGLPAVTADREWRKVKVKVKVKGLKVEQLR